jgi:hypothetical protein
MIDYNRFLDAKRQLDGNHGFDPLWMPAFPYDFQQDLICWALKKGRAAIFADCGLGKTPISLVWAENVVRETNKPVLILAPIAVSHQFVREGEKFDIDVANYERMHYFDPEKFGGVVCDESSCIKHMKSKRKAQVVEFLRTRPYRLLCTATAAPNDYFELGTSSEALGYLGYQDMLTRFFKEDSKKDYLGWGRKTYRFRGHAEPPFWRWVCSWARSCRRPSDLGYEDGPFVLPPLEMNEHNLECNKPREGMLFAVPAKTMQEQRDERRTTLRGRCEAVAELVSAHDGATVSWCHLNAEGDLLEKIVPDALQVKGSMSDDQKEERLLAFQSGELKRLVTKPKIGAWGLNWPHCHHITTFPSHSFEAHYQSIRRCWRFGQQHPVAVHLVTTEGEIGVLRNLQRKAEQCGRMFDSLVAHMNDAMHIYRGNNHQAKEELPSWL